MNLLLLGRGKTGSLVAEVARQHHHKIHMLGAADNPRGSALRPERLQTIDIAIDFTTPAAVIDNIAALTAAGKNIVVGTTGWYDELPRVRQLIEQHNTGLVYAANFSIGVNLFFDIVRVAAAAPPYGYLPQIFERHHVHKKDAPSGTAIALQRVVKEAGGMEPEITSFREGEVVGMHEVVFESPNDRIYLCHDATSRRGFAEGAVRAAEWLIGKKGLFDFKDVWRDLG
jgi:4-hydroxy-tetrahydrodipicolinate reductase